MMTGLFHFPEDSPSDEQDPRPVPRPYNTLLQAFQQSDPSDRPQKKRRKLEVPEDTRFRHVQPVEQAEETRSLEEETIDEEEAGVHDDSSDPFETHFANPDENELSRRLSAVAADRWSRQRFSAAGSGTWVAYVPGTEQRAFAGRKTKSAQDIKFKQRLLTRAHGMLRDLAPIEQEMLAHVTDYRDVLFGARRVENAARLRHIACAHALNHVFKTRDKVLKNNAKQLVAQNGVDTEHRDQGFTRPKVLFLTETRQACARVVQAMTDLCDFEQQENRKRFLAAFYQPEDNFAEEKPADFRELFGGNDDNEFRVGIKFTRKTLKFFSMFYNSDIILASPLGLRRAIEAAGQKKDYDFLSSIELVVMDQADAIVMQNWDHVEFVFDHLNLQPKDAHGCDFSRVRTWYLDGHASNLRHTIVLSAYLTPELNGLFSKHMRNVAGKVKFQPVYEGVLTNIAAQMKQTFSRYDSPSPATDPDSRFKYFTTGIVPALTRLPEAAEGGKGVLIFIPSYLDFVRVRNYFARSNTTENVSFGAVSEYVATSDVRRARSHFQTGRYSMLLYTGRAHHFRRYKIRGVKRIIMYALPENPVFYEELVGLIDLTLGQGILSPSEASVRILFSKWDGLRLERVVGTKRMGSMLKDRGDTFEFI